MEEATDFENELLGVDFWLFTRISSNQWGWLPINIALHSDKTFKKQVIRIILDLDDDRATPQAIFYSQFRGQLAKTLYDFSFCGQTLLTREGAMATELLEFPLTSPQPA